MPKSKFCRDCGNNHPVENFNKKASALDGLATYCKPCIKIRSSKWHSKNKEYRNEYSRTHYKEHIQEYRHRWINLTYGLSYEDYNQLLQKQSGGCAICGIPLKLHSGIESEYEVAKVDHCHKTGKVRGLLCHKCNIGLGNFNDNVDLLEKAKKYIKDK